MIFVRAALPLSELSHEGRDSRDDDSTTCIPHISGSTASSRLLSEFHILSEIGRGAFGDVIKVFFHRFLIKITAFCDVLVLRG